MGIIKYAGVDLLAMLGVGFEVADGMKTAPPVRGANLGIPYQHGRRATAKKYDERHIVLNGELLAATSVSFDSLADQLKALFPIESGEQRLEMQWPDGSWRYVMAEVRNVLMPVEGGLAPLAAKCSIELVASDPFWYGSVLECATARLPWYLDGGSVGPQMQGLLGLTLLDGVNQYTPTLVNLDDGAHWLDQTAPFFVQTLTASPQNVEATNSGDYPTRRAVFTLNGQMVNPKLRNLRNEMSVQVNGSYGAGSPLVIDCGAQQATIAGQPVLPSLIALGAGQTDWMRLEAGENTIQVTPGVSSPSVAYQASYSPAYL